MKILRRMSRWFGSDEGQTTIEYLLVVVLLALVLVLAFQETALENAIGLGTETISNHLR